MKKFKKEDIEDYICDNEELTVDKIVCPYCKQEQECEPEFLYEEREDELFECQNCAKTFLLSSEIDWWYTTVPIKKEVKKILELEKKDERNKI